MFDLDPLRRPEDVVPAVVPLGLDVGTNDEVAMAITHLAVYPTGFGFGFTALTKVDPGVVCADELELARNAEEDPIGLQFHLGVEFADGRRADSLTTGSRSIDPRYRTGCTSHPTLSPRSVSEPEARKRTTAGIRGRHGCGRSRPTDPSPSGSAGPPRSCRHVRP
jgi:hypothetical protein